MHVRQLVPQKAIEINQHKLYKHIIIIIIITVTLKFRNRGDGILTVAARAQAGGQNLARTVWSSR